MGDAWLYRRGIATAAACWARFAAGTPGAAVHRTDGAVVAVFPAGPEREVYNNAVVEPGLAEDARARAADAVEHAYSAAGVVAFAAWVHESDAPMRAELERRGYRVTETTRAMGMSLADLRVAPPTAPLEAAGLGEHVRAIGVPGLLAGVDGEGLHVLVVRARGAAVATALAAHHDGDCGIFNVGTEQAWRRRGLATALTAGLLHDALARGCTTATLQSTPAAERLYASLGFRDLGRILEYAPRGRR